MRGVLDAGLPLEAVANGVNRGILPLDFTDSDVFRRFAGVLDETFQAVSDRTGIPMEWLSVLREVTGWGPFEPDGRIREDELEVLPWLEAQARLGFRRPAVERLLRSMGDALRRLAEAQAEWCRTEIQERYIAEGRVREIATADPENRLSEHGERALLALFRAQEAQTWIGNVVIGFVMFHFREPSGVVAAALQMVRGVVDAGLPPAHVGIHAGPVVVQSGDYYGQTVNLAARIAEYARPGEVLVTEPVRRATAGVQDAVRFVEIGAVELKGVSRPVELFSAMA